MHGPRGEVRPIVRWADAGVEALDEGRCRVRVRAESIEWLVSTVAMVAVVFDVEVDASPEVTARIRALRRRLGSRLTAS